MARIAPINVKAALVVPPPGAGDTSHSGALHSRALRHNHAFLILFFGQAVSLIGRGTATWALPFLALVRFQQPWLFGVVTAAAWAPSLLAAIPAGVLADHVNRKVLLIVCDTGRAALLGSVVLALLLDRLSVPHLLVVAFGEAALAECFNVTLSASLPEIVGTDIETFSRANALTANLDNLGQTLGPACGGLLAPLSWLLPFGETAVTFGISALSLTHVHSPFSGTSKRAPFTNASPARGGWERELREGITWLWRHPTLRMVAVLSGLANIVMIGLPALLTLDGYSLGFSPGQIGLVVTMCGLGALAGAAVTARVVTWWGFGPVYIALSLLQALLWPVLLLAHSVPAVAAVAAVAGAIDQVVSVAQKTYRGLMIPDVLRARVQGAFRTVIYAGGVAGLMAQGAADQRFGLAVVVWTGTILLAVAGIWSWLSASIRRAPHPTAPARPTFWLPAEWANRYPFSGATRTFDLGLSQQGPAESCLDSSESGAMVVSAVTSAPVGGEPA